MVYISMHKPSLGLFSLFVLRVENMLCSAYVNTEIRVHYDSRGFAARPEQMRAAAIWTLLHAAMGARVRRREPHSVSVRSVRCSATSGSFFHMYLYILYYNILKSVDRQHGKCIVYFDVIFCLLEILTV